ncbi:hypothetical protein [Winogradskyella sp. 3972H.M.0a.05]|uniref:hypothetical protein n=1 Tax=Winogradskyella sp. 3972H.M.0a.05 TaxID=2950277 RepID=UPI00339AEEAB
MIVNPQLFNYRLIISSLIVAIAVLTVFSFSNYISIEQQKNAIEEEKKLVESELSQMISTNDDLTSVNTSLSSELEDAKQNTKIALDSLRLLNSDLSVIAKYKDQARGLVSKNKRLEASVETLETTNAELEEDVREAEEALKLQQDENTVLTEVNESLKTTIEEASALKAMAFDVSSYNTVLGRKLATTKASKTNVIDVCITLAENVLTKPGKKDIYIQIVDPRNNVFADKGVAKFDDSSLIYSAKTTVHYRNQSMGVCTAIGASKQEMPLLEGKYYISAFHNGVKLGSTEIYLK